MWVEYRRIPEAVTIPPMIVRELREPAAQVEPTPAPEPEVPAYQVGVFQDTKERQEYVDGALWFYFPRIEKKLPVYNGTGEEDADAAVLKKGIMLFRQAQLPGPLSRNSNVAIAGHRDVHNMEFYNLDKVELGDRLYLRWEGDLYMYQVVDKFVTHDRDWDPIRTKDYSCITLQTCTPLGKATHRLFIVGKLIEIVEGADFPESPPPISSENQS